MPRTSHRIEPSEEPRFPTPAKPPRRERGRAALRSRVLVALGGLVVLVALVGLVPNERIRRSIESRMNGSLKGYSVSIGRARLQPIGLSLSLENLVIRQSAHPDPPILSLPLLHASVHWKEVFLLKLVADFRLDRPRIYANLAQLRSEARDPTPVKEKGWQQAVEAIYPLKINQLRVNDAAITYVDADDRKPIEITHLDVRASNIRNIHSREHAYPSPITARAVVFGTGRAEIEGHADFLAEPYAGVQGTFRLARIPLGPLGPVGEHWNVLVSGGELSASGDVEYAPKVRNLKMPEITLDRVRLGYRRGGPAAPSAKPEAASSAPSRSEPAGDAPKWTLALDRFRMTDSRLELVDATHRPSYTVYVSHVDMAVDGLASEPPGHLARATAKGRFMDEGEASATATFRPGKTTADLDLKVELGPTPMTRLNDLFRAYGKFDVAAGTLQFFSEIAVHDAYMHGYVKPIFQDVKIYDPEQDANKGLFQKIYEGAVDAASKVLRNHKHDQIATNASIDGPVGNAHSSLFDVLGGVLENAFIRAILPGFDRQVGPRPPGR